MSALTRENFATSRLRDADGFCMQQLVFCNVSYENLLGNAKCNLYSVASCKDIALSYMNFFPYVKMKK